MAKFVIIILFALFAIVLTASIVNKEDSDRSVPHSFGIDDNAAAPADNSADRLEHRRRDYQDYDDRRHDYEHHRDDHHYEQRGDHYGGFGDGYPSPSGGGFGYGYPSPADGYGYPSPGGYGGSGAGYYPDYNYPGYGRQYYGGVGTASGHHRNNLRKSLARGSGRAEESPRRPVAQPSGRSDNDVRARSFDLNAVDEFGDPVRK